MIIPDDLKYTREHEWLRIEGDTATVGITDYAQGELGDVVFVELPQVGTAVKQNEAFGTIEAVKAVSELYSPLTGKVSAVNEELEADSSVVNSEPYEGGWMIKITGFAATEVESLLDAGDYRKLLED
ncbi:MAG: glycine cleavage system protein GcvH [bacterium]